MRPRASRLLGQGTTNCVIEYNEKLYRVSMEPYEKALALREKENNIKRLLASVPDRDDRFGFSIDNSTITTTLNQLKKVSPTVYEDILACNAKQDITLTQTLIITQYKALEKLPKFPDAEQQRYLKESLNILHDHGVYHFDIRQNLGNIMWNGTNPVIIDFDEAQINPRKEDREKDYFDFDTLRQIYQGPLRGREGLEGQERKRRRLSLDDEDSQGPKLGRSLFGED